MQEEYNATGAGFKGIISSFILGFSILLISSGAITLAFIWNRNITGAIIGTLVLIFALIQLIGADANEEKNNTSKKTI